MTGINMTKAMQLRLRNSLVFRAILNMNTVQKGSPILNLKINLFLTFLL